MTVRHQSKRGAVWLFALPVLGGVAVAIYFVANKARNAVIQATRTPQDILWAVQAVDPEHAPDLQKGYGGPSKTWCNKAMYLLLKQLGIDVPWGEYGTSANDIIAYIDAGNDGWYPVSKDDAQSLALQGQVAVATYYNYDPNGHGHMGLVLPIDGPMQIAQAGNINRNQTSLESGFGFLKPVFYAHA